MASLKSLSFADDGDIEKTFRELSEIFIEIADDIKFFEVVWEYLMEADNIMDTLFAYNQELEKIIASNHIASNEAFLRSIESTIKTKIANLHDNLNKIDFPMSDSEKTSSILLILRPIRQAFQKLVTKIKKAIAEIETKKTEQQSDAELAQLKSIYEKNLEFFKKSKNILRYNDICWPSNGTIEQDIQVLLHGAEKTNIRKTVHQHQKF